MLLEFSVCNYRSFKDLATLSLMSTPLRGKSKAVDVRSRAMLPDGRAVLRTAVIYGANASGKSNLIFALDDMREIVVNSARQGQAGDLLPVCPFRLSALTASEPSYFEVVFIEGGVQYRYGFEATPEAVRREWLFHRPKAREVGLFEREGQNVKHSAVFSEGTGLATRTRPNALFLSVVAQFNGDIAGRVLGWFHSRLHVVIGLNDVADIQHGLRSVTTDILTNAEVSRGRGTVVQSVGHLRQAVEGLLKSADLGIESVLVNADAGKVRDIRMRHRLYGKDGKAASTIDFDLDQEESDGTKKLFTLAGPLVDALDRGLVVVVDELDARMHPLLTRAIVELFHDVEKNPKNAQLVFATHDVNLLDPDLFRRDQVWFVEKDGTGGSTLVSLAEYRGVRNNAAYRDAYLRGSYRAIPILRLFGEDLAHHE